MTEGPRVIAFEVTRKCRFNCIHCRAAAANSAALTQLSTAQCKHILKSISELSKPLIILTGGEPLERPDIFEIASYAHSLQLPLALATCGYLLNQDAMAKVKECGIAAISFSLDGATAQTHDKFRQSPGAYDAVLNGAALARAAGIRFQINTTITRDNVSQIDKIAKLAIDLGASCYNVFVLVPIGRGEEIAQQVLSPAEYNAVLKHLVELKRTLPIELRVTCGPQFARLVSQTGRNGQPVKGCLGARQFGFVSYTGDVQMCGFLHLSAGNLVEQNYDFAGIWQGANVFKEIRDTRSYKGNCGKCEYVNLCGGCRARAYSVLGDHTATDPICDYEPRKTK